MNEIYLLGPDGEDIAWQERARCATSEPDVFLRSSPRQAVKVCRKCPVLRECGEYADRNEERFGIWGGRDRSIRRRWWHPLVGMEARP